MTTADRSADNDVAEESEAGASRAFSLFVLGTLFGGIAGFCTLAGIIILVVRRRLTGPVFMATTVNDKVMYVLLVGAIVLGLWTTLVAVGAGHDAHNYRESVSPWFRSIFLLNPQPELMAGAPPSFQVHAVAGLLLIALWPFTRLVHAFSAPLAYVTRPYVVYRDRGPHDGGNRPARRGWEKVG